MLTVVNCRQIWVNQPSLVKKPVASLFLLLLQALRGLAPRQEHLPRLQR